MLVYKISQLGTIKSVVAIDEVDYDAIVKFREIIGDGEYTGDFAIPVVSGFRVDIDGYLYAYVGVVTTPTKRSWELARLYAQIGSRSRN